MIISLSGKEKWLPVDDQKQTRRKILSHRIYQERCFCPAKGMRNTYLRAFIGVLTHILLMLRLFSTEVWDGGEQTMTASDTQGERTTSAPEVISTAERAYRTSRTFRSVLSFVGGLTLGFLPLFLYLFNHLTISLPLFPFNPRLTFCTPQTHMPVAKLDMLDTVAFILYPILVFLGVPAIIAIGKAFHWIRSTITLCVSGLLLAVVLELFFYFAFLLLLAFRQCFHLVG
jgi:hypothetical protein